jgi:hypothetical protein
MHNSATCGGGGGYTATSIGPGTYDTKLNNNSFAPDISGSPLNNMNMPIAQSHSQKIPTSIGALASLKAQGEH